jgi:quercetin dioxygenase-like cupin family protein
MLRPSHTSFTILAVSGLISCGVESLPLPAGVAWAPNPFLAPGAEWAVVAGTPQTGGAYAMRIRFPAGFRVMPHTHPDDRIYTVLTGTFEIGIGAGFDSTRFNALRPGEVVVVPAGTPHFHRSPNRVTEFQVNGVGPTGIAYVDPTHDPRRK